MSNKSQTIPINKRVIYAGDVFNSLMAEKKWSATEAADFVKKFQMVDAVEVVHGRWEDEYGGKYANPRYRCSVCKKRALYKFERDLLGNYKEVQALTPNCPYCVAKLDGGKGE